MALTQYLILKAKPRVFEFEFLKAFSQTSPRWESQQIAPRFVEGEMVKLVLLAGCWC
jgi:hypothetical protein